MELNQSHRRARSQLLLAARNRLHQAVSHRCREHLLKYESSSERNVRKNERNVREARDRCGTVCQSSTRSVNRSAGGHFLSPAAHRAFDTRRPRSPRRKHSDSSSSSSVYPCTHSSAYRLLSATTVPSPTPRPSTKSICMHVESCYNHKQSLRKNTGKSHVARWLYHGFSQRACILTPFPAHSVPKPDGAPRRSGPL